jgi:hypothetical protein
MSATISEHQSSSSPRPLPAIRLKVAESRRCLSERAFFAVHRLPARNQVFNLHRPATTTPRCPGYPAQHLKTRLVHSVYSNPTRLKLPRALR